MSQVQLTAKSPDENWGFLLDVKNLQVFFPTTSGLIRSSKSEVKAVDGVSFQLAPPETLCIVGESGSGKTTIARCVTRLTNPTGGTIKWNGKDISSLKGREYRLYRKAVQFIFQDPFESLYSKHDVFTTVSTPLIYLAGEKDRTKLTATVTQLLQEVGLDPSTYMHRLPYQLSGGEMQRVSIARALASNPRLLVADEPVTMLDASQRSNVLSLLLQLRTQRKLAILFITHDLASAKIMSDRIMVMYRGKIVESGRSESVLATPRHPYTKLILESTPRLRGPPARANVQDDIGEISAEQGCAFRPRCRYATSACATKEPELLEKSEEQYASCHNPLS